ncbi:MAG TPA: DUF4340 domain-containing protein [Burkholderiales bacterium]|nr:DUF4340 domain-containing protein [Burkholderiales bacterium]
MRSWIGLAALSLLVLALGVWISQKPRAPDREAHALTALTVADVTRIRLERPASAGASDARTPAAGKSSSAPTGRIELERRADGWHMTAPFPARADAVHVERLLAILDERSVARYRAADLERYGLDRPVATLTLNDQTFAFGAVNTMTREQYVLARDGVYAIPLSQRTALPRDGESVVSRALFAQGETPLRFELEGFTATLVDGKWIISPVAEEPGPDERNGWVAAWRQATAMHVRPHDGRKPLATISVALKDGRTVTLGILEREPELVLLRLDERIQYHFLPDVGKRLLSPPGAARTEQVNK